MEPNVPHNKEKPTRAHIDPYVPNDNENRTRAHNDPHVPNNKVYMLNEIGRGVSSVHEFLYKI